MSRRRIFVAFALPVALVVAGCGGDAGRFDASTDAVRAAVDAGDRDAAIAAVDALAIEGLAAHEAGALDDAEVDEFAQRVQSLRTQIDALLPAPPPTTTPASPERDADEDDDKDDDHADDKGRKGKKKDDDD